MNWWLWADVALAVLFVIGLGIFLYGERKNIKVNALLKIGKVPLIYMAMLHTTWGIALMQWMADRYGRLIRFLGYISIGISAAAAIFAVYAMGLMVWVMFKDPVQASAPLALPYVPMPFIGAISFLHWIIILGFIATIHEFAHGVVSKSFGIKIKSSGVAVLGFFIPIIPAAFVEPEEKSLRKEEGAFYSVISAGPAINVVAAVIMFLIWAFLLVPWHNGIIEEQGFVMSPNNATTPSGLAGFNPDLLITDVNGVTVNVSQSFITQLQAYEYPTEWTLSGVNQSSGEPFALALTPDPRDDGVATGFVGATVQPIGDYTVWYGPFVKWLDRLFWLGALFSFSIGIINMLPMAITDGGQIFNYLFNVEKNKKARKVSGWLTLLFAGIIIAGIGIWLFFALTGGFN